MQRRRGHGRSLAALCLAVLMLFLAAPVPVAHARKFKTIDEVYLQFARKHPTFGGLFVDGKRIKIWLTDDGQSLREVYAALKEKWKWVKRHDPVALPGRWNWVQLYEWYIPLSSKILTLHGASFGDISEGSNRLEFGVQNRQRLIDRINREIASLGVPRAAVRIVEEPVARPAEPS